jgi:hypothetical protein
MLLFLNIDCALEVPADADGLGNDSSIGLRRLEAFLRAWPQLRIVVTSERRYRMTLEHFRSFFAADLRHRLMATTFLYAVRPPCAARTREDEVLEWLRHKVPACTDWLAIDDRAPDYTAHAERVIICSGLSRQAIAQLHSRLLMRACERESVVSTKGAACLLGSPRAERQALAA